MINETLKSIKEVLSERISNPALGSFSLFWFAFNWQIPIIVFKSNEPIEKTAKGVAT
jgi:hypothetical protein